MGVEETITLPGRAIEDLRRAAQAGAVAPLHPFYKETLALFRSWNIPVVGGAPVGVSGSYAWLQAVGKLLELDPQLVNAVANEERERAQAVANAQPLSGRVFVTGYEGSELAYARLLVEGGLEVPYVSTSIGQDPLVLPDELWLRARGVQSVVYRKSLEDDVAALDAHSPDLVLGTTPFCVVAKERGIPAMYFTNQLASRPFFLSTGHGGDAGLYTPDAGGGERYQWMRDFFSAEVADG
jgi:3,8-divinyl chlorophyllide a/chlorophyllide a reductase subunit Y